MKTLKVGIAGFGVVGKRRKEFIDAHPRMQLIAVCDKQFQENGVSVDGLKFYANYQELLKNEFLDVLFVCMSNDMAAEVTIAGIDYGLHVFCEKPPGRNPEEILRVIAKERLNPSLKLMYGFNHRYHDSVQEALIIQRSGALGKVINLRGLYGKAKLITFNQPDWRTKRDISGGGVLLDQGIHMLDLMRLFGGEFSEIHSFISNKHWGYDVEDNAYAIMRGDKGVVGMIHSSATQWRHRFSLDINLERGSIILGGIITGTKSYGAETLTVVHSDPDNDFGDPKEQMTRYNKDNSWSAEIAEFYDCIANNRAITTGSSSDALRTMQLVYKIYYSDPSWRDLWSIPNPNSYE
ncbi:MviM Predicted dehydrogenases and related proteins [Burkholderiaceae bacterium]